MADTVVRKHIIFYGRVIQKVSTDCHTASLCPDRSSQHKVTAAIVILNIVADKVADNTIDGTGIINSSASRRISHTIRVDMITDEVPDNTVNGAAIINRPTPATNAITMFGVIADEVPGNTVDGAAIQNRSGIHKSMIGYKITGNITDSAAITNRSGIGSFRCGRSIITDKISGNIADGTIIINRPTIGSVPYGIDSAL